jgi:hypothetical protein
MRYVIVDPEGSSRAYFGSLRDVREWADALKHADPELLDELLLMTYDAAGNEVANQWLSDFTPPAVTLMFTAPRPREGAISTPTQLTVEGLAAGWSGMATSTIPESRHPHRRATDTLAHAPMEMAVR